MAKLINVFITGTSRRLLLALVWFVCFCTVIGVVGAYAVYKTSGVVDAETRAATEHFLRLRANLIHAFQAMQADLTAAPCSKNFADQFRQIAYRPDGFSEFVYAPDGVVQCTSAMARLKEPIDLGPPDIDGENGRGLSFWIDRKLDILGMPGAIGSIALLGNYGAVIPRQEVTLSWSEWLDGEVTLVSPNGDFYHRAGVEGIYSRAIVNGNGLAPFEGKLYRTICDTFGLHCLSARADLWRLLKTEKTFAFLALIGAMILATWVSTQISRAIRNYWSFEGRFARNLTADSVICAYQPILNLRTGEISGCEVLARWRDVDGTIVAPNQFINLVERNGKTQELTTHLARRAFRELTAAVPNSRKMQVNFNIFPQDLDAQEISRIFAEFLTRGDRFQIVLEIIECDEMPENAQHEIENLRRLGIKTYIDDFGTGYSNMQNLAALSVDGVKLDRAFAMAPDNSMMAQMLRHAIEMMASTGRAMVVEGVESAERLELLRSLGPTIDYVQGYYISKPLDIDGLAAFLESWGKTSADMPAIPQPRFAV